MRPSRVDGTPAEHVEGGWRCRSVGRPQQGGAGTAGEGDRRGPGAARWRQGRPQPRWARGCGRTSRGAERAAPGWCVGSPWAGVSGCTGVARRAAVRWGAGLRWGGVSGCGRVGWGVGFAWGAASGRTGVRRRVALGWGVGLHRGSASGCGAGARRAAVRWGCRGAVGAARGARRGERPARRRGRRGGGPGIAGPPPRAAFVRRRGGAWVRGAERSRCARRGRRLRSAPPAPEARRSAVMWLRPGPAPASPAGRRR